MGMRGYYFMGVVAVVVLTMLSLAGAALASWSGSVQLADGAAWSADMSVPCEFSASSSTGSVTSWRYWVSGQSPSSVWGTYAPSTVYFTKELQNSLYVQFRDSSGSESPTYSDSISIDTHSPATWFSYGTRRVKRYRYLTVKYVLFDSTRRASAYEQPIWTIKNSKGVVSLHKTQSWRHPSAVKYVTIGGARIKTWVNYTWRVQVKLPKGNYRLILHAVDLAGNSSSPGMGMNQKLVVY